MKPFDISMPTFNSVKLLPVVLPQIEKVIPASAIHKKFIIDNFSTDDTMEVTESLGWTAIRNKIKGVENAQKYGFSLVETECYAVFEHDVFLAENWFKIIPPLVYSGEYDVAQGIRIVEIRGFRDADIYDYDSRIVTSQDNAFYRIGKDGLPLYDIWGLNYKGAPKGGMKIVRYCVRRDVCSRHLKGNLTDCLMRFYFIYRFANLSVFSLLRYFVSSPFLSLKIFKSTHGLSVLFVYPMERFFMLLGELTKKMIDG